MKVPILLSLATVATFSASGVVLHMAADKGPAAQVSAPDPTPEMTQITAQPLPPLDTNTTSGHTEGHGRTSGPAPVVERHELHDVSGAFIVSGTVDQSGKVSGGHSSVVGNPKPKPAP